VSPQDFKAMLVVLCGDELARLEKDAVDELSAAAKSWQAVEHAPALTREPAEERLLDAEAVAAEFGAIGKEC
jgi:hypothetical protein